MNNIKELRKEKGLTQSALAELLGINQTSVCRWESGISLPDTVNLLKLSEIFSVSTDYILGKSKYFYPENVGNDNLFTSEELRIIEDYRKLSPSLQRTIKETLKTFLASTDNEQ